MASLDLKKQSLENAELKGYSYTSENGKVTMLYNAWTIANPPDAPI